MQFIPSILLAALLPFLPKSPRWLGKVGREKEAIQVLARIQAHGNESDPLVIAEWEEIVTTLEAERAAGLGWKKFVVNGMWKRTLAGMSVQAWQQLAGANAMVYYLNYIAEMAGLKGNVAMVTSGIQVRTVQIFLPRYCEFIIELTHYYSMPSSSSSPEPHSSLWTRSGAVRCSSGVPWEWAPAISSSVESWVSGS